ncbi:hypothetical protein CWI36_0180p0030 [Hamiltosporidium magnivora]|uniref:Uncharacterized protein n=2 Tax=Hamiltosporidium magnivora TaxID=148818 RepID=A0A4Q9LJC1_9MICR|nr:hypothetical protein CWI36_0180p0030 [Hamiltosporidium magnivora]
MIFDIILVSIIIGVTLYLTRKSKEKMASLLPKFDSLDKYFLKKIDQPVSIYQHLLFYSGNNSISNMAAILTLKKDFCPFYYILSNSDFNFILTGTISAKTNIFIVSKKINFKHLGMKYAKKSKTCIEGYKMYYSGFTSVLQIKDNYMINFCSKYPIDVFYLSYLPEKYSKVNNYESKFYLKSNIENIFKKTFFDDFLNVLSQLCDTKWNLKTYEENIKAFDKKSIK